jgi:hypothetical protein
VILPGHLAAAWLATKATRCDMGGAMSAAMFPDLVDKPIRWLLGVTPNDRIPAHTALGLVLTSWVARRVAGPSFARGWLLGYSVHLACDEINAHLNPGRIYFLWPFRRYAMHRGPTGLESSLRDFTRLSLIVEAGMVLLAGLVWRLERQEPAHRRTDPAPNQDARG